MSEGADQNQSEGVENSRSGGADKDRFMVVVIHRNGPEKLSDAFLGLTLPFYIGCTNLADYFPEESFIRIDINDPDGAIQIMRKAIADGEFEKRLPAIKEARRRVLYEYNYFALIAREIERRYNPQLPDAGDYGTLYSRHALRKKYPFVGARDLLGKIRSRFVHRVLRRD